jgi:type IV pilus assembly protein PilM
MLQLPSLPLDLKLGRRRGSSDVVGLDVQPGFVAAVKVRASGSIRAERAAAQPLAADAVREGEVVDPEALTEALRELFSDGNLGRHVRVGIANQRTVMRTLELPPITDRKELAAAVRFQAQDEVPMPLSNAVLDFHALGIFDSPAGPRQRVVLVAAQRDMVERLLGAVRAAGLTPEGIDLSAFALIRSLYDRSEDENRRVLYVNVDGLTNLAIAEGKICRFTRVVGGGVEAMAAELAVRRSIALPEARALLATVDLSAPTAPQAPVLPTAAEEHERADAAQQEPPFDELESSDAEADASAPVISREEHEAREGAMGYRETIEAVSPVAEPAPAGEVSVDDVREILENGVREIAGEVRNSLDFHRTQDQGGEVAHVALSGAALDLPGFAEALQSTLAIEVRSEAVGLVDAELEGTVSTHRLSVAAGLATTEVPQ